MSARVDLSEFEALTYGPRPTCGVTVALGQLDDKDRAKLEAALAASHIPSVSIARWCKDRGIRLGDQSVSRHRRKVCRCDG